MASYSSKRRRLKSQVEKRLAASFDNSTFESQSVVDSVGSSNQSYNSNTMTIAFHSMENSIASTSTCASPKAQTDLEWNDCTLDECLIRENLFDSESDSFVDSEDENGETNNTEKLRDELAAWSSHWQIKANGFTTLLALLSAYFPLLPKDSRTVRKTPRNLDLKAVQGGSYFHFGIVSMLSTVASEFADLLLNGVHVLLQVNIDGLPLFKSSGFQLWPILGRVCSPFHSQPFIIGLFCGKQKPANVHEYLKDFVDELDRLQHGPVDLGNSQQVQVDVSCFICDAPARAFLKQVKGHSGYYGCEKCKQKGSWEGRIVFPDVDVQKRTDAEFRNQTDINQHIGISPLVNLFVGMVTQFPFEYMHLVCLGVMKRLLWYWTRSPVHKGIKLGVQCIGQISKSLLLIKKYVPREFNRQCRSLDELERWKASECRQFLLYSGIAALKGQVSSAVYKHFLLLFVAVYIFASPNFAYSEEWVQYAHGLLCEFVSQAERLYGKEMMVYNVHGLTHLADDVRTYGPLDCFSAFTFENFLGGLKRLVRSGRLPKEQIVRRIYECQSAGIGKHRQEHTKNNPMKEHFSGPLVDGVNNVKQFQQIFYGGLFYSVSTGNNCVKTDNSYYLIRNILSAKDMPDHLLVVEEFKRTKDFF